MNHPTSTLSYDNKNFLLTWIKDSKLKDYNPINQVYGIVFNDKGEILIAREKLEDKWAIPGGKPEAGENIEETLRRELVEEVDVSVSKVLPLGAQKVELDGDSDGKSISYQLRCIALLKELLPQTPDPAHGSTWERRFVPAEDINKYIKWGELGTMMFKDAIDLFKNLEFR